MSSHRIVYAVMQKREEKFRMHYYHLPNQWQIVVPIRYQIAFLELAQSYGIDNLWAKGVFGSFEVLQQLIEGLPIQRVVAIAVLKQLSDATGHPYDLENVRFVLAEETSKEEEHETNLVRY